MRQYSKKQICIAMWASIGSLLCGMSGGWSAPIIPKLKNLQESPLPYSISEKEASWVGSSIYAGVIIGPYVTGFLSNMIGRKPCLLLGGLVMGLSYAVLATSVTLTMILLGRVIAGVACGIIFVIHLVYVSEIASTKIRGALLSLNGIAASSGILACYSICPYVSYSTTSYIALGLSVIFTSGMLLVPETPVFYLLKGNTEKAKEVLSSLGRTEDVDDLLTKKDSLTSTKQDVIEIFTVKNNRKTLSISLILFILQNGSGATVLLFFSTSIFNLVEAGADANISTIVMGATMLVASCVTPVVVDRYGRKIILLISTAVCGFSLMVLGFYFFLEHINYWMVPNLNLLPVISLVIFFLFFNSGFGVIPGTLMSEMFQSNVRGPGSTIVMTTGWLIGWINSTTFGYMDISFGTHVTFWIYSSMCALAFIFTAVFVPETKGKTFAKIQCILSA